MCRSRLPVPPRTTKTLHPLPFHDLEPHRFEDLVRQLAYEFRDWHSLEAVGRSGSDDGIDIRGTERPYRVGEPTSDDAESEGDELVPITEARSWIFQCKREKAVGPKRVREAVAESLPDNRPAPYGFVLAVACDLSKKARDVFREEMVNRGVEEFFVWRAANLRTCCFNRGTTDFCSLTSGSLSSRVADRSGRRFVRRSPSRNNSSVY